MWLWVSVLSTIKQGYYKACGSWDDIKSSYPQIACTWYMNMSVPGFPEKLRDSLASLHRPLYHGVFFCICLTMTFFSSFSYWFFRNSIWSLVVESSTEILGSKVLADHTQAPKCIFQTQSMFGLERENETSSDSITFLRFVARSLRPGMRPRAVLWSDHQAHFCKMGVWGVGEVSHRAGAHGLHTGILSLSPRTTCFFKH